MGFKVKYNIMERGKTAPYLSTYDRQMAYVELNDLHRRGKTLDYWMDWDITPLDLTKQEEYMWFVYQVRQAQKKYWRDGKDPVDLHVAVNMETELDRWNSEIREKLNKMAASGKPFLPYTQESTEAFQFFVTVEEWRKEWKNYFAAKKAGNKEEADRLFPICRAYETRIETYCKLQLKL